MPDHEGAGLAGLVGAAAAGEERVATTTTAAAADVSICAARLMRRDVAGAFRSDVREIIDGV